MTNDLITITSRNYDGSIRRSWQCRFIERDRSMLLLEGVFDEEVDHAELGVIRRGTISYEYYWLDRWYNILRFHEPRGEFRNFYCNISMPPRLQDGFLDYVDLDIDIVIWPDGRFKVLDELEFQMNAAFPQEVKTTALETADFLVSMIQSGNFPPD